MSGVWCVGVRCVGGRCVGVRCVGVRTCVLCSTACEFGSGDEGDEGEHTGQVGTEIYMSPELVRPSGYSFSLFFFEIFNSTLYHTQEPRVKINK